MWCQAFGKKRYDPSGQSRPSRLAITVYAFLKRIEAKSQFIQDSLSLLLVKCVCDPI